MKIEEVPHGRIDALYLVPDGGVFPTSLVAGAEARLIYVEREAIHLVASGKDTLAVRGEGRKNEALMREICTRNLPRLAWIVDVRPARLHVQVHSFVHDFRLPEVEVGVDEKSIEAISRFSRRRPVDARDLTERAVREAIKWLDDQLFLRGDDGEVRAFMTAEAKAGAKGFEIHGRQVRASVLRVKRPEGGEELVVETVTRTVPGDESLALMVGAMRFVDATAPARERGHRAGALRMEARLGLAALSGTGRGFLQICADYRRREEELTMRHLRSVGALTYESMERLPKGRFAFAVAADTGLRRMEEFVEALREEAGQGVEAGPSLPPWLSREMTWDGLTRWLALKESRQDRVSLKGKIELRRRERVLVLNQEGQDTVPPPQGVLYASVRGIDTSMKRRKEAVERIQAGACPMPHLREIIEDRVVTSPRRGEVRALTPAVKRKVWGERNPTLTQEKAVWAALNTPDIALIQGPPGTGKTTVIVALVERLQEVWETAGGIQGRLLLSGFQHDAVENAMQRMSVNGLPPIKFGDKDRSGNADAVGEHMRVWCDKQAALVRKTLPPEPGWALRREVAAIVEGAVLAPGTLEQTASLLRDVAVRLRREVSAGLVDRMHDLSRELFERVRLLRAEDPDTERLVRLVRSIRCTETAFMDDGVRSAHRVAEELRRQGRLDAQAEALLEEAASWTGAEAPPFLDALGALRRRLLLALCPRDATGEAVPRVREDVVALLTEARDELDRRHRATRDAADEAVLAYLDALESDPEAMRQAIMAYTSVFAATCQQSARQEIFELKGSQSYDTVVVDEAARANPLDLLVPLAQAGRRIVLVGDHRQLPHILNRELEKEIEQAASGGSVEARTLEMLRESMFEQLFRQLRAWEKRDGFPRVVTLDEQYRMHPTLGAFVSREFYEKYDEAFGSPRPAESFVHGLPGWGGPAGWLDVPGGKDPAQGAEEPGQSKSRRVEAKALVAELRRLMDDSAVGQKLSFGVITFYKAQVGALYEALEAEGMAHQTEEEGFELAPSYRHFPGTRDERLRVGTVDAFQGMEFDVVFLSMVRSNTLRDVTETERRRKFGHLMSLNRLCVAMSRQKKLVIVAGDTNMLRAPHALEAIGPLVRFWQMCEVRHADRV